MYNPYYNTNLFGKDSTHIASDYIAAQGISYIYDHNPYVRPSVYSAYLISSIASALYHQNR